MACGLGSELGSLLMQFCSSPRLSHLTMATRDRRLSRWWWCCGFRSWRLCLWPGNARSYPLCACHDCFARPHAPQSVCGRWRRAMVDGLPWPVLDSSIDPTHSAHVRLACLFLRVPQLVTSLSLLVVKCASTPVGSHQLVAATVTLFGLVWV